jgi:hypothetical protein
MCLRFVFLLITRASRLSVLPNHAQNCSRAVNAALRSSG